MSYTRLHVCVLPLLLLVACDERAMQPVSEADPPPGFTPEQASQIAARVGDRDITVADLARRLEDMPRQVRKDYQSKSRRRALLDTAIDDELLAAEAVRRGLQHRPGVKAAIGQSMVEAMLSNVDVPSAEELPAEAVRAFYEDNKSRWVVPERRRVAMLTFAGKAEARTALTKIFDDANGWRTIAIGGGCEDGECDRGHVGPPGDPQGANPRVPAPVRRALFALARIGDVTSVDGARSTYVIRYSGRTAAQSKGFAQSEQSARNMLRQELYEAKRDAMISDLKKRIAFEIHDLSVLHLPDGFDSYVPYWERKR